MTVEFKDYYKTLGVDRRADDKTLKSAYRRLARKYHPDVAKGKDTAEKFKEISEAYAVLSDPEKRRRYDTLGPDWQRHAQAPPGGGHGGHAGDGGDFSDFFRTIFGDLGGRATRGGRAGAGRGRGGGIDDLLGGLFREGRGGRPRGEDVQAGVEITLEDAWAGARRRFAIEISDACGTCGGAGHAGGSPCATCLGTGWQRGVREVDVKLPAGVRTGQRVRVAGEGGRGASGRGDLYLAITVAPHPVFERTGDDIHLDLPLTPPEAALGASVEVPTLRGRVSMRVPPGTSSGRAFRLPGYGMPRPKAGGAGDQIVHAKIVLPAELTPAERECYERLRALGRHAPRAHFTRAEEHRQA